MWSAAEAAEIYDAVRAASKVVLHRLHCSDDPPTRRRPWKNGGGPVGAAYHWTGGASLEKTIHWFNDPGWGNKSSSAHVLIGDAFVDDMIGGTWHRALDDSLATLFPLPTIMLASWGRGAWCTNWANGRCLGIELRNSGQTADTPRHIAIGNRGRLYERYTREQLVCAINTARLARAMRTESFSEDWIVGHSMIWARKSDPGPDFPLHLIRHAIFEDAPARDYGWLQGWPAAPQFALSEGRWWSVDHEVRDINDPPTELWLSTEAEEVDESQHALWVADALFRLGWPSGPVLPEKRRLRHFVSAFQRSTLGYVDRRRHLKVDGLAGPQTRAALGSRLNELDL